MVLILLSRGSRGHWTKLNHEETVRGPEMRKMLLECFFATKTLMRERITENTRVQFPVGTKVRRGHLVYVASGITSRRTKQLYSTLAKGGRPAFLPGTGPLRGL